MTGTSDGVPTVETLTWTKAGYKRTTNLFTAISDIDTTGLSDEVTVPTLAIRAVGQNGSPVQHRYTLIEDYPAQVDEESTDWPAHVAGGRQQSAGPRIVIPFAEHFTPRNGDLLTDDLGRNWELQGAPRTTGTTTAGSWWCPVKRWEVD